MRLLVLIIGGNPISNYGLIKYFGKDFDKIVLIHTSKTKDFVANFAKLLEMELTFIDIGNNERNLLFVEKKVFDKLRDLSPKFIHLNYTGGTKSMSIGAYNAIKKLDIENICSDIDSKLFCDNGDIIPKDGSINDNININIEEFTTLYSLKIISKKTTNYQFYSQEFAKFLLDRCIKDEESFYTDLWDINNIATIDRDKLNLSLQDHIDISDFSKNKLKSLQKFIKGVWLENYIFDILTNLKEQLDIIDIAWNVEIKQKNIDFEVDIVATKGYNVYLFSCTTAYKKNIVKTKFFEAEKRATQIGGIGAKAVLVSLYDDSKIEEDDMKTYVGRAKVSSIKRTELLDKVLLEDKLKEIFR
jgi:plasmid maintenance system killer protein